ncbi:MAG: DNA replication/repair protein RecF [Beutenbergiaceae bacterium]
MYVSDVALTDFRSYADVAISLGPGITTFVGRNGQGKTNLVEAIGYLATFSSHRVASDMALVRHGAERGVVRAKIISGDRATVLELEIVAGRANRARLNRSPVSRTRDLLGHLRTVLFAPEDLTLVKGDPDGRRRFLDDLLVSRTPRLAAVRTDYERLIKQRNALLKTAASARRAGSRGDIATLDVWDAKTAAAGAQLIAARIALLQQLRPHVRAAYQQVSDGQGDAELNYRASIPAQRGDQTADDQDLTEENLGDPLAVQEILLTAMTSLRTREIERGVSLVGPHRDDLDLRLGELPAKGYASHGESWSLALALRLASYQLLRSDDSWDGGGDPVLILDDVFAELDARRRERLAELVADAEQVLITAAVADDVPAALSGVRLEVMNGTVTHAG